MAKRLAVFLAALVLSLALSPRARAEVAVSLQLDRSEATLADTVELTVSVSGARGGDLRPTLRGADDFRVSPAGASTRVEIVNGRYSAGMEFTFVLQPKKAGTFRIGPAEVTVDGKLYQSGVATLAVGAAAGAADGAPGPVFLVAALSPGKVYAEQHAVYSLKLYRSVNIGNASVTLPEVDGVSFSKLGEPREFAGVFKGQSYRVIEVRYLVAARKAATYTLPPARMDLTVFTPQNRRRGVFDDPFFGQANAGRPHAVTSEALTLQVLALPPEGRPADFGGLVGQFTLEASVEPQRLRAGESATLTATVSGRGNVKRIPELKLPPLDGVKIYADQPAQKEETDADGVSGAKIMKWALVPERDGRYRVPVLALSYFDTSEGRYRTLKTQETVLTVEPGAGGGPVPSPARPAPGRTVEAQPRQEVAELGRDILPVHAGPLRPPTGLAAMPHGGTFWALLLVPPAAFLLILGGVQLRRRSGGLMLLRRSKSAAAVFFRLCKRGDLTADELLAGLQEYLNQRLRLDRGSLTADEAAALLRSRGVAPELVDALTGSWRRAEDAIYTGKGREQTGAGEDLAGLVARLEKALR